MTPTLTYGKTVVCERLFALAQKRWDLLLFFILLKQSYTCRT
jgi:hypothetical protein